jgi:hypothetical protein
MPAVTVPSELSLPLSGKVPVTLVVHTDGTASLESCDAAEALCVHIEDALSAASFEPGRRDGEPIESRVAAELTVVHAAPSVAQLPQSAPREEQLPTFSSTAEVEARSEEPTVLELQGIRSIPGTLGEPFRSLELLPSALPVSNGQPFIHLRGAPPVGTVSLYDDIAVPELFHAVIGPQTIHPGLIGDVKLYSAVPPARFGGLTGGVLSAEKRAPMPHDRVHGEAELRAIDTSALLNVPVMEDGSVTMAGRYGFPNGLLNLTNVDASIDYWDYQLLSSLKAGRTRFELLSFGARDDTTLDESDPSNLFKLDVQFYRVEARLFGLVKKWQLGGAVFYGYDFSDVLDRSLDVPTASSQINRVGPRFWAHHATDRVALRLGAQMMFLFGGPECLDIVTSISSPCNPEFAEETRRMISSAHAEASIAVTSWLDLALGLRADVWNTAGHYDVGVGPRVRATFKPHERVDVFAAWGLGYQPATFVIPLPGLGDVPLEPGLQRASQSEAGLRLYLPKEVELGALGFINVYDDLRFFDFFTDATVNGPAGTASLNEVADGKTWGLELSMSRPFGLGFASFASYALGYSELEATTTFLALGSFDYTPSYDVRHMIKGVFSWQSDFGLSLGTRLEARSGRALGWAYYDGTGELLQYVQRAPWFVRLDVEVAYDWARNWGLFHFGLEWINLTRARDAQDLEKVPSPGCLLRNGIPDEPCDVVYSTAIWFPNLTIRAQF